MNINDGFGLLELAPQTGILGPETLVLLGQGIDGGLSASLPGGESVEFALLPLTPPCSQVGGVQALPAQQGADGALLTAGLGLLQDRAFVLRGEPATLGRGRDLGIGDRWLRAQGPRPGVAGVGSPSAPVGIATLPLPALRGCQLRRSRFHPSHVRLVH